MSSNKSVQYTNVVGPVSELHDDNWVIKDVYLRILTGDILSPLDARELMLDYLEDGDLKNPPKLFADAYEVDDEQAIELTVESLWNAAHDTALAWNGEVTDADRLYSAIFDLAEDSHIRVILFGSVFDCNGQPGLRGLGAIPANAWKQFDYAKATPITVVVDTCRTDTLISEIAIEIADAFEYEGLSTTINDDFSVTVNGTWRHHVQSYEDALAATSLLPQA